MVGLNTLTQVLGAQLDARVLSSRSRVIRSSRVSFNCELGTAQCDDKRFCDSCMPNVGSNLACLDDPESCAKRSGTVSFVTAVPGIVHWLGTERERGGRGRIK